MLQIILPGFPVPVFRDSQRQNNGFTFRPTGSNATVTVSMSRLHHIPVYVWLGADAEISQFLTSAWHSAPRLVATVGKRVPTCYTHHITWKLFLFEVSIIGKVKFQAEAAWVGHVTYSHQVRGALASARGNAALSRLGALRP